MAGYTAGDAPVALGSGESAPGGCAYYIVGTFSGWKPRKMNWNKQCFEFIVTIGMNQWEAFQVLLDGSWKTIVHPSIKRANPAKEHVLNGPDDQGHGYDWVMGRSGFNPFGVDLLPVGAKYRVEFFVDAAGKPARLAWNLYNPPSEVGTENAEEDDFDEAPDCTYHIVGTWKDWNPEKEAMKWDGECFSHVIRLGSDKQESFQVLQDKSWEKRIYPSKNDAHPYMTCEMKGPDSSGDGYNWTIAGGAAGRKYRVKLFVDRQGNPKQLCWDLYAQCKSEKQTVIAVAGLASSCLEMKPTGSDDYIVSWCNVKQLVANPARVFRSLTLRLVDGTTKDGTPTKTTASEEGFEIRPLKGTVGLKDLNPTGYIPVPVWQQLVDALEEDFDWHAFDYDWRRWSDRVFAEETVERFRVSVEEALKLDGNSKAALIGHSQGAPVILYCLSVLDEDWVKDHISQVILVAPAHLGSPSMVSSFAFCPFVDTQSWLPVPGMFDHTLGDLTATWACMIGELPVNVGGAESWPEDYVFAITPDRQYRLQDMGDFLTDLAACKPHREIGPAMWPGAQHIADNIKAPVVPTSIIYASGTDTPYQVEFDSSDLGKQAKLKEARPGDGTIVAESLEACAENWKKAGSQVSLLLEPGASATSHKGLIVSPFTIGMVPKILRSEKLTPLNITIVSAKELMNTDMRLIDGVSDPYCCFEITGKPISKRRTAVIDNNLNPEWNHEDVIYSYDKGDALTFTLYDMDAGLTQGDFLGRCTLTSDQIEEGFEGSLTFLDDYPGSLFVKVRIC